MKASKARNGSALRTVTFRITPQQHKAVANYALKLSVKAGRQISMNTAVQKLFSNLR